MSKALYLSLAGNTTNLPRVLSGNSAAFVKIHEEAMLHLVAGGAPFVPATCPETLLFDVHRLGQLRTEFEYISLAAAMLVTVGSGLAKTRKPEDAKLLGTIAETFASDTRTVINVEETLAEMGTALKRSSLTEAARDALVRQLRACAVPTDAVNQLLTQRTRAFWSRIDQDGQIPVDVQFMGAAKALVPRISRAAGKLRAVTNLNRIVHSVHYNRIIGEEAQKIKEAQATATATAATAAEPAAMPED